jgi:uncharacterized protein (TIGR00297 family)
VDEEIYSSAIWRKAIPRNRDRMQSQILVALMGSLLVWISVWTVLLTLPIAGQFPVFVFGALGISIAFASTVLYLKAATPAGALYGGMICLILLYWTGAYPESLVKTAMTPLGVLFVLTYLATKAGKQRKAKAGLSEDKRGRSASQVIANLGFAAVCCTPWMATLVGYWMAFSSASETSVAAIWIEWTIKVMCLAALVEATADTVSSEIGQAYGGPPVLLLNLKRVAPGSNGAVTLLGTSAGIAGGCVVAIAGVWAMHLHAKAALVATGAGTLGLFFDSLLGATVERRGWIGNDLVNFTSTVFAGVSAALLFRYLVL